MNRNNANNLPTTAVRVVPIRGDGRCMFRSVARALAYQDGNATANSMNAGMETALADSLRSDVAETLERAAGHPRSAAYKWFLQTRAKVDLSNFTTIRGWWRALTMRAHEPELTMRALEPELFITDIKKYAKSLRENPGTHWASTLELALLPNVIRRPIKIYSHPTYGTGRGGTNRSVYKLRETFRPSGSQRGRSLPPVCLEHMDSRSGNGHYQLLLLRGGSPRATARTSNERIVEMLFLANRGNTAALLLNEPNSARRASVIRGDDEFRRRRLEGWSKNRIAGFLANRNRGNAVQMLIDRNAPLVEWQVAALAAS